MYRTLFTSVWTPCSCFLRHHGLKMTACPAANLSRPCTVVPFPMWSLASFWSLSLSLSSPLILGSICQSAGLQSRAGQWEERGFKGNRVQAKAHKPQTKPSIEWRDAFQVAFSHHRPLNFTSSSLFYEMLLLRKIKIKAKSWRWWGLRRAGCWPDLPPGGSGLTCGHYHGWNLDGVPLPTQGWMGSSQVLGGFNRFVTSPHLGPLTLQRKGFWACPPVWRWDFHSGTDLKSICFHVNPSTIDWVCHDTVTEEV